MKNVIATSREINSLADLKSAISAITLNVPTGVDRSTITFVDTLRLQLIEGTLTDGSKVYDLRLIED